MNFWKYIYYFLVLILAGIGIAISQLPDGNLHIVACDVGQGDAILITYKNTQILTDGGQNNNVLTCLGRHLPFWDRKIELVILTHSDADHSTGLIEVVKRYKVATFLTNSVDSGTQVYRALDNMIGSKGVQVLNASLGQRLGLGKIYLDILAPTHEQLGVLGTSDIENKISAYVADKETNSYSIVYLLSFGQFDALFTGDIPTQVSNQLSELSKTEGVEYIKVPHHGSKNGLTESLLEKIVGEGLPRQNSQHEPYTNSIEKASAKVVGVISVGKNNRYGHPHQEILDMLKKYNVKILRTDEMGDVELLTDGKSYWFK